MDLNMAMDPYSILLPIKKHLLAILSKVSSMAMEYLSRFMEIMIMKSMTIIILKLKVKKKKNLNMSIPGLGMIMANTQI